MKVTHIPFQKTGFFSKMMIDYLEQSPSINNFYNNFPDITGFKNQLEEKQKIFKSSHRKTLNSALQEQYKNVNTTKYTKKNIDLLLKENTFTITTGHQLNLFTGPLYFVYKILCAINLCEDLKKNFPNNNFVPVYWMATEDHDFDEIKYFNYKGEKVIWNREDGGAVGRFSTNGLDEVFKVFENKIGNSNNAKALKNLFSKAYLEHNTLSDATRFLANELFGKFGLVIIDGDDKQLKQLFTPYAKDELLNESSHLSLAKTITKLEENYGIQVNPREINLFYLGENFRERIIKRDEVYFVNNTKLQFTKEGILKELEDNPTSFSPNVIMRPLYQEVILPNLCYIGGGGEQAYWLQLKEYFNKVAVPFPILLLRNSVQVITKKQADKLSRLNISFDELFLNQHELLSKKVVENSDIKTSFEDKKNFLRNQFKELKEVAKQTDVTFLNAVNAQEKKQLNGLDKLEKRLLKAEKHRQKDLVDRITKLQNDILPNGGLEERQRNFSEYYLQYGAEFIELIKKSLQPLKLEFTIVELD
ncbi:MAG: bacillithiol biosynthesis cysteine-adding enzyme BshC [Flavobacteriaceae bacterium]|nr:bacillithiol biosynthesis cysteine-adding enzyme BshC [Flavobacteriaceae bacterium]